MPLDDMVGTLAEHVAIGSHASVLSRILSPRITLAVWRRPPPDGLGQILDGDALKDFVGLRVVAPAANLPNLLPDALAAAGVAVEAVGDLVAEISDLGLGFAELTEQPEVDVRLECITGDACRKFHADWVTVRLITTYQGRGTEWLELEDAAALADGASIAQLPVRSLVAGDVALLKGRLWADDRALVHRSPPIAGTGERRLVLVINPGDFAPDEALSN
jgi:hypothetical protein